MKKGFRETSQTGATAWLLQRLTAVILFVLLGWHFIIYHFVSQGRVVSYQQVLARVGSWWFPVVQFLFLLTGLYHGLNGFWTLVEDYFHSRFWRLFWYGLILTAGAFLLFIGSLTIIKVAYLKAA